MMKQIFNVKYFGNKGWVYCGTEYLNSEDTQRQKEIEENRIRQKYRIPKDGLLNIYNDTNVYC